MSFIQRASFASRGLLQHCASRVPKSVRINGSSQVRCLSSTPLVSDITANVTFVNFKGERFTLTGLEGQSLVEVCASHDKESLLEDSGSGGGNQSQRVRSSTWTEDIYGEGATSNHSHVIIPPEWYTKLPEPTPQEAELLNLLDDISPNSRLGSEVRLTKELDGLLVYIPDPYPCDIP
mmetsp:Transcript_16003/g.18087  ORF Transcript_16003/g.18087 Transcript_16003/m.18087 type:complete len:178 (-) Transcript_16003:163-696(-)|eukprot:CAMPEP_0184011250 /NCGR_PEP_ID=MMETSP0954-20121128/3716_1 /TAXON_ID=627963 /ORGANISM="Aplanochytrium sp, Strain PBS07" /LENGTH=177 /DNA_ID=CAMNT_0026291033 /DNA_START=215 /DNA_END=748 /DNA_ORIENTATION=-